MPMIQRITLLKLEVYHAKDPSDYFNQGRTLTRSSAFRKHLFQILMTSGHRGVRIMLTKAGSISKPADSMIAFQLAIFFRRLTSNS
jgi:hypothetical protein